MTDFRLSPGLRLALICVLAASLGLAACGRKGPLDAPPGALQGQPQGSLPGVTSNSLPAQSVGGQPTDYPTIGPDSRPVAPKGPKKQIPLDVLLN